MSMRIVSPTPTVDTRVVVEVRMWADDAGTEPVTVWPSLPLGAVWAYPVADDGTVVESAGIRFGVRRVTRSAMRGGFRPDRPGQWMLIPWGAPANLPADGRVPERSEWDGFLPPAIPFTVVDPHVAPEATLAEGTDSRWSPPPFLSIVVFGGVVAAAALRRHRHSGLGWLGTPRR